MEQPTLKFHVESPHRRRYDLTGCHMSAILLERLVYWWTKGKVVHHGEEWRAKPHNQLLAETALSAKQLRTSLALLKQKGLIKTSQHHFGSDRRNVFHYRLLGPAVGLLSAFDKGNFEAISAEKGQPECALQGLPLDHKGGIDSPYVSSKEEDTSVENCKDFFKKKFLGKEILPKPKNKLNAAAPTFDKEALAAKKLIGSCPGKSVSKPKNKMAALWIEVYKETYPGSIHVPFTMKQLGQLKQLHAKLAGLNVEQVIRNTVQNWSYFVAKASSEAGAFDVPKRPDIGVVLKFVNVAANLKAQEKVALTEAKSAYAPAPVAQLIAPKPKHVPLTAAQVIALLKDEKD